MVLNASSVHASDHVNGRTAGLILKKASVLGRADSLDSKILVLGRADSLDSKILG